MTSIVDPKYRVKKEPDWMAALLAQHATKTKTKTDKVAVAGTDPVQYTETKREVPDGVDVDALFALAGMNKIDVAKFEAQREGAGFAGRFRMTVANMLRAAATHRHGMFLPDEKGKPVWTDAPKDWLTGRSAGAEPSHDKDGKKIVKAPPAKDPAATTDAKPADEPAKKTAKKK